MSTSRYAYAEYDAGSRVYITPTGGELSLEEAAELQAGTVEKYHGNKKANEAYKQAVTQLVTKDFNAEMVLLKEKIRQRRMWGGPVPKMVLMPDQLDKRQVTVLLTMPDGTPRAMKVRADAVRDLLPPPEAQNSYYKNGSYYYKPTPQQIQRGRQMRMLRQAAQRRLGNG